MNWLKSKISAWLGIADIKETVGRFDNRVTSLIKYHGNELDAEFQIAEGKIDKKFARLQKYHEDSIDALNSLIRVRGTKLQEANEMIALMAADHMKHINALAKRIDALEKKPTRKAAK